MLHQSAFPNIFTKAWKPERTGKFAICKYMCRAMTWFEVWLKFKNVYLVPHYAASLPEKSLGFHCTEIQKMVCKTASAMHMVCAICLKISYQDSLIGVQVKYLKDSCHCQKPFCLFSCEFFSLLNLQQCGRRTALNTLRLVWVLRVQWTLEILQFLYVLLFGDGVF